MSRKFLVVAALAAAVLIPIAARAHEIYQARGGEHGKAVEDWLQAEREIDGELFNSDGEQDRSR